jgi:hypothetical protein
LSNSVEVQTCSVVSGGFSAYMGKAWEIPHAN